MTDLCLIQKEKRNLSASFCFQDSSGRRRLPKSKTTNTATKQGLYQQTYYTQPDNDTPADSLSQGSNNGFSQSSGSGSFWSDLGLPQSDVPSSKPARGKSEGPARGKSSSFQELLTAGEQKASQLSRRLSEQTETAADGGYSVDTSSIARDKPAPRTAATKAAV